MPKSVSEKDSVIKSSSWLQVFRIKNMKSIIFMRNNFLRPHVKKKTKRSGKTDEMSENWEHESSDKDFLSLKVNAGTVSVRTEVAAFYFKLIKRKRG